MVDEGVYECFAGVDGFYKSDTFICNCLFLNLG